MLGLKSKAFTLIELLVVIAIIAILASILFPVFAQAREKARQSSCLSSTKNIGNCVNMYLQDYDETFFWQAAWDEVIDTGGGYRTYIRWPMAHAPYLKNTQVYWCPSDRLTNRGFSPPPCNGGCVPYPMSYGPNLSLFHPDGARNRPIPLSKVDRPAQKVALAEASTPYGFENWNVEYFRAANFRSGINGWTSNAQWRGPVGNAIRLGTPADFMANVTRHLSGNIIIFTDGHAKWFRWDRVGDSSSCEWKEAMEADYNMNNGASGCTIRNQPRI